MISRKQFLKDLLYSGFRALNELIGRDENCFPEHADSDHGFDLSSTELSPALLAIEAERREIDLRAGCMDELRQAIYQDLAQNGPDAGAGKT